MPEMNVEGPKEHIPMLPGAPIGKTGTAQQTAQTSHVGHSDSVQKSESDYDAHLDELAARFKSLGAKIELSAPEMEANPSRVAAWFASGTNVLLPEILRELAKLGQEVRRAEGQHKVQSLEQTKSSAQDMAAAQKAEGEAEKSQLLAQVGAAALQIASLGGSFAVQMKQESGLKSQIKAEKEQLEPLKARNDELKESRTQNLNQLKAQGEKVSEHTKTSDIADKAGVVDADIKNSEVVFSNVPQKTDSMSIEQWQQAKANHRQEQIRETDTALNEKKQLLESKQSNLEVARGSTSQWGAQPTQLEAEIRTLEGEVLHLEGKLGNQTKAHEQITRLDSKQKSYNEILKGQEELETNAGKIKDHETKIGELHTKIDQLNRNINSLREVANAFSQLIGKSAEAAYKTEITEQKA
ncbi:MAG: hypothetical protein KDK40_05075, partial [Chlamydiia bacterium]|nr:hypothetical protein [Chlamydiia bacterium]